jgi:hypothetical protein
MTNRQSRETSSIGYTRGRQTKQINVREYRRDNENRQSRETSSIGHTRGRQTNQKHNTIMLWYIHT